ncbi:MAG: hypothetical protein LIO92_11805 [Clostridiales bacterium]|nr:hypothetical protein [Clostridiales bacterium]
MGNDNKKGKQRGKKFVWFERMLRREGRKLCAVALCASMIIGNMAWPAAAANDTSGEYSFELSRASLYDALQVAVSEGETVETDLEFMGEWAEDYAELLEADGSLYELSPTIKNKDEDRDKVLDLRVFARIENDIEFDSAYEIDGSEEIIFLLVNSSEVYQKAVIAVDERESDTITVLPASAVEVDTEEAVTVDTVNPVTTTTTMSGGGGGGSHSTNDIVIDNTEESEAAEYKDSEVELLNDEDPTGTTGTESNETEAENETEAQEEDDTEEQLDETSGESTDPSAEDTRGSDTDTEEKKDNADGTGTDTENSSGNAASENSGDNDTQSGEGTGTGDTGNENTGKDETSSNESESSGTESSGNSGEGNTGDSGITGNSGETGTDTGSGSGSEENAAGDTTSDSGDSGNTETDGSVDTDNSGDDWGDSDVTVGSAISVHPTWRLTAAATSSDAEQDVASPSDADDYLAGTIYKTVRLDEDGAVAFVTTAGDMELDDEIFTVASASDATKLSAKTENVSVVVSADEGVLPEGVELVVTELSEDDDDTADQYQEAVDALTDGGVEYDDMLALDISLIDENGDEIEPDGNVGVTISLNKEILPEEADIDSLSVLHLADTGSGVNAELVADAADETDGSVTEDGNKILAEFEVESFSYFVISYNNTNQVCVYLFDENGDEILGSGQLTADTLDTDQDPGNVGNSSGKWNYDTWISLEGLAGLWGDATEGYTYQEAHLNSYDGTQIYYVRYNLNTGNQGYWGQSGTKGWRYSTDETQPDSSNTTGTGALSSSNTIYLIYTKDVVIVQSGALTITDTIATDGCLNAVLDTTQVDGDVSGSEYSYVWYRSSDGSTWEEVERLKVTGSSYNISEDGTSLNVALDGGAQMYYKVALIKTTETEGDDGETTVTKETIVESSAMKVDYYDSLQNGDFEEPDVDTVNQGGTGFQFPEGTTDLVWQTTGSDNLIEIVSESSNTYNSYNCSTAYKNNQWAELNAEAAGALYQDVLTVPGSTLYWGLAHRARQKSDTMYLVIAPADKVQDITTQDQLNELIKNIQDGVEGYTAADGFYLQEITDDTSAWMTYTGEYDVPEGQYLTRFFFVAGDTGSDDATVGNFLDDVYFSTELPDPDPDTGNITVIKTVQGLSEDDIANYSLNVTLSKDGSDERSFSTFNNFAVANVDGSYSLTRSLTSVEAGTYTLEEIIKSVLAGELSAKYDGPEVSFTVTVGNGNAETSTGSTNKSTSVTIEDQKTTVVEITNTYTRKTISVTVNKTVEGNMGDRNKEFQFTATVTDDGDDVTNELSGTYQDNGSDTYVINTSESIDDDVSTKEVNEDGIFTLSNGQSITFEIPYGAEFKVAETDYADDGYTTTIGGKEKNEETFESVTTEQVIEVVNKKEIQSPTGVFDNRLPYALMVMAALLGGAGIMIDRKRKLLISK